MGACGLSMLSCSLAALLGLLILNRIFTTLKIWSVHSLPQLLLRLELPARAAEQSIRRCSLAGDVSPLQMSLSAAPGSGGGVITVWLHITGIVLSLHKSVGSTQLPRVLHQPAEQATHPSATLFPDQVC